MRGLGLQGRGRGRRNLGEEGVTRGAPLGTLGCPEAGLWEVRHPSTLCFSESVQRTLGVTHSVAGLVESWGKGRGCQLSLCPIPSSWHHPTLPPSVGTGSTPGLTWGLAIGTASLSRKVLMAAAQVAEGAAGGRPALLSTGCCSQRSLPGTASRGRV